MIYNRQLHQQESAGTSANARIENRSMSCLLYKHTHTHTTSLTLTLADASQTSSVPIADSPMTFHDSSRRCCSANIELFVEAAGRLTPNNLSLLFPPLGSS